MLCKHPEPCSRTRVKKFYANLGDRKNLTCYVWGKWVPFREKALSQLFKLKEGGDCSEFEKLKKNPHFEEISKELTDGQGEWQSTRTISHAYINRGDLIKMRKVWFYVINYVLKPSMHVSTVRQDRTILRYALVKGYEVNLGRIVEDSVLEFVKRNFTGNIPHPSLITLLCIKGGGGVKFNEDDERCPKTSPLILIRVLKAPVESEEREAHKEEKDGRD